MAGHDVGALASQKSRGVDRSQSAPTVGTPRTTSRSLAVALVASVASSTQVDRLSKTNAATLGP